MSPVHVHQHSHEGVAPRRLLVALVCTCAFVILEAAAGARAGSLALLSDAGHNFADAMALALALFAIYVARRPSSATRTFGFHRAKILAALCNASTLLVIALLVLMEAVSLFRHPARHVESGLMIGVAVCALVLNTAIALSLRQAALTSVNVRSAYIHMAADAVASAAVIGAGMMIAATGWTYADPIVSALIAIVIVIASIDIVRETGGILLEGAPRSLDTVALAESLQAFPGVRDIHDLHVWSIADGMTALSCHLKVDELASAAAVVSGVKAMLSGRFHISHSTIETECEDCSAEQLYCTLTPSTHAGCSHDH